jgi:hypothetical protein
LRLEVEGSWQDFRAELHNEIGAKPEFLHPVTLRDPYISSRPAHNSFTVFMPYPSSATICAGGLMTPKTSVYLEGRYVDRHLLMGALYTLVGLAGVWLLASYLSAIQ